MKKLYILTGLSLLASSSFAQTAVTAAPVSATNDNLLFNTTVFVLVFVSLVLFAVLLILLRVIKLLAKELLEPSTLTAKKAVKMQEYDAWEKAQTEKPSIWSKLLSLKPLSEEKDMMLDHSFDGIAELDNPTPPWFMWLFYATIAFAVVYLVNYHVLGYSPLQEQEYANELQQAQAEKTALLAKSADRIDENSVKKSDDAAAISGGKTLFLANCVACHGDKGQGLVGPNLTDEYWIHGGTINDVFKTIKYGVPEKGMISWEKTMTPKQLSELANFVLSIKGSNPANPKAPQGTKE
ncbi:MAG: cbb3-type cytochrome c oxidase N-terminal domain-containing protein [Sphingobacteriaceae bacterium]